MTDDELIFELTVGAGHFPAYERPGGQGGGPQWIPVVSSNVKEIIHWPGDSGPEGASLGVRFYKVGKPDREYHYWNVPHTVAEALLNAYSHGRCHWELIRRRGYRYFRVR